MKKIGLKKFYTLLMVIGFICAFFVLYGCNSGSSDSNPKQSELTNDLSDTDPAGTNEEPDGTSTDGSNVAEKGTLLIGLTDAEGDFLTYNVNVVSLKLTKADGVEVETLPLSTEVDFVQYAEMTEFLTSVTVPSGLYTKATMKLNYADADIRVENAEGDSVAVENITDVDNNPISEIEMAVQLDNLNSLLIVPGVPANLTLDFNLQLSNSVSFDENGDAQVIVEPTLIASVNPEKPKEHRLRGALHRVDTEYKNFKVNIFPFFHKMTGLGYHFGNLLVLTGANTEYEIDGVSYTGEDGLYALDTLDRGTAVIVKGELKLFGAGAPRFEAGEVIAGSSVPGVQWDVITGNVIERDADTLAIKGAGLITSDGRIFLNDTVLVTLHNDETGASAGVIRQNSKEEYGIDDISVGQRVTVFGVLDRNNGSTTTIDATEGTVKMLVTVLKGVVKEINDASPASIALNLQSIDLRPADAFDFEGTGTISDNDADPENYEIATGNLDLSNLTLNEPIKVKGFVNAHGQAPADFDAQTIIDLSDKKAYLKITWDPSTIAPFETLTDEEIVPDLAGAGLFHHLGIGWVLNDLNNFEQVPSIVPDDKGLFIIFHRLSIKTYTDFSRFTSELNALLDGYNTIKRIYASGYYNGQSSTITSDYIDVTVY